MIRLKKIEFDQDKAIKKRGLYQGGKAQKYIDSEVMRLMDPYTPFRVGTLKTRPMAQSRLGTGKIIQQTPYAKRLYYNTQYNFNEGPRRGAKWFDRMKANHKSEILRGLASLTGGRGK